MKFKKRLERAERRLSKGWCQSYLAVTKKGEEVDPNSRRAAAWCFVGAFADQPSGVEEEVNELETLFAKVAPKAWKDCGGSIPNWNDSPRRTHKQVLAVVERMRKAVAAC